VTSAITGRGFVGAKGLAAPRIVELLRGERTRLLAPETVMALAAARLALRDAGLLPGRLAPEQLGIVVATRHAGLHDYVELFETGVGGRRPISPLQGPQTGLNAPAAHLSIRLRAAGPNATIVGGSVGALDALRYAAVALADGRARAMLVCGCEAAPAVLPAAEGGAVAVVLEARDAGRSPRGGAVVRGVGTAFSPSGDLADAHTRALAAALRAAALASADDVPLDAAPAGGSAAAALARVVHAAAALAGGGTVAVEALEEPGAAGVAVLEGCDEGAT